MKLRFLQAVVGALMLAVTATRGVAEDQYDGHWHLVVAPYVWLPSIDGTLRFDTPPGAGGSPEASTESSILENLNFAAMLAGEARKGNWAILTDFIYLDFGETEGAVKSITGPGGIVDSPANINTSTGLTGVLWQLVSSYTVARSQAATLDGLVGFRYLWVDASLDWQISGGPGWFPSTGNFSQGENLWDGIVGVRGRVKLGGSEWFIPYYLDVGAGSSKLTWQGDGGIGYSFGWGDMLLAYRYLFYDQGNGKLLQDVSFGGPLIGAAIRF